VTRVETSNYRASDDTTFAWATSDNDFFDREMDLYSLAKALESHDHTSGKGLAARGYEPGSIPTSALVPNPIFPGPLYIASGGLSVAGGITVTSGGADITGNIIARNAIIATGAISSSTGGLSVAGQIATSTGGLAVTGNSIITGNFTAQGGTVSLAATTVAGALSATGTITSSGGNITAAGAVTAGTAIGGASLNIGPSGGVIAGGLTINTGALTVAAGAISAAGKLTITTGGADITGQVDLRNNATVWGAFSMQTNAGILGTLTGNPAGTSLLGAPGVRWAALHTTNITCYGGNDFQSGITVSSGTINCHDITIFTGTLSVTGSGAVCATFVGHVQPGTPSGTYDLGQPGLGWRNVYSTGGIVSPSVRSVKEFIEPLDPAVALQAVRATKFYEYQYIDPHPDALEPSLRTRGERHVGFLADEVDPLLLVAEGSVNPQTTASVALAAIRALAAEVDTLRATLDRMGGVA
jgi:hypothetical protein